MQYGLSTASGNWYLVQYIPLIEDDSSLSGSFSRTGAWPSLSLEMNLTCSIPSVSLMYDGHVFSGNFFKTSIRSDLPLMMDLTCSIPRVSLRNDSLVFSGR